MTTRRTAPDLTIATAAVLVAAFAVLTPLDAETAEAERSSQTSPREVVERFGPAVVLIEVDRRGETGQGTGFVLDGRIVTSLHVIDGGHAVTVALADGRRFEDVVVRAFDVGSDLVVLALEEPSALAGTPEIALADVAAVEAGDEILVVGNPLGLAQTATEGIVSAWREPTDQESACSGDSSPSPTRFIASRLIQISAAISPGSSGAPIFDDRGRVIGVATSGVLHGMAKLNFATPIDGLARLLAENEAMDLETLRRRSDADRLDLALPDFEDAEVAYQRDDREIAKCHVERALALFPRYADALLLAGRISLEEGRHDLAELRFGQAIAADEHNAEPWYLLGVGYDSMGSAEGEGSDYFARAAGAYEKALELDGRHAHAALNLANIRFRQGRSDDGERLLRAAIDAQPGMADAHYLLGELYLSRDEYNDAQEAFEQALWENEDHALSHLGLARLHMVLDQSQGIASQHGAAPHHWEEFLRLSEGDPTLAEQRRAAMRVLERFYPHLLD